MLLPMNDEMLATYGYAMTYTWGVSPDAEEPGARALFADLRAILRALSVVVNNGPDSVGGGGEPRVPAKPPICGAPDENLHELTMKTSATQTKNTQ